VRVLVVFRTKVGASHNPGTSISEWFYTRVHSRRRLRRRTIRFSGAFFPTHRADVLYGLAQLLAIPRGLVSY